MAETALNFGPDWLRALANEPGATGPSQPAPVASLAAQSSPPSTATAPKYSLAKYRYGREEMLALIPKDVKKPDCLLHDSSKVVRDTFVQPLALMSVTEEEQRLWSRSVNSDAVLRASGKSVPGNMGRSGRGGSIDRGRGRGRGGYYQRGITSYDHDSEDVAPGSFSRPKTIERSQSANEKDQRWDDRDRRYDRPYSGRGGLDDNGTKLEHSRSSHSQEYWRKNDKDEESDWRSSNHRSSDKTGARGSWRNPVDKERRDSERNPSSRSLNGNSRSSVSHQKVPGHHLPEWSVEEGNEQDVVGTFDSSGAFLETKVTNDSSDDIYISDEADEGMAKDSPEAKNDSSAKKTPPKMGSPPRSNVPNRQHTAKQNHNNNKSEELAVEPNPPKQTEPPSAKTLTNSAVKKSANHVIKTNNSVEPQSVNNMKQDSSPVTLPNVPENTAKIVKSNNVIPNEEKIVHKNTEPSVTEEDAFAHHKKATENMVAQWTEEEEQRVISQSTTAGIEADTKWFYQDPQGEIQGPFKPSEMSEWFNAGYFTMSLMVRRTCDEKFSQLGELIKSWGGVPFMRDNNPPPIRATPVTASLPTPPTQAVVPNPVAAPVASQLPKQDEQLLALQQQLLQQQLMQQQLILRQQAQLLSQLKHQDNFSSLNTQQQQQVLMQHFMSQQQIPRPNLAGASEQSNLMDTMTPLPLPLLGLPMAPLLKNDLSLWNLAPATSAWPLNVPATLPSSGSIWDVEPPKQNPEENELEKQKRFAEEQEKLRRAEEERQAHEREMEEKKKMEELRRKQEEERLLQELKKQQEEKQRLEELKRQEEERKRQEEHRRLEEQRLREEEKRRQEEELRKIQEQKRLEELKRQEEERLEELRKKEEERRQEELRKQKQLEEQRKKEELQKKLEMEQEQARLEFEKQREAARLKELEREEQLQRERQKQKEKVEEMRRLAEIKLKSQGPAWGVQNSHSESQLSLPDIQRLQEEKEKQEREEKERLRQQQLLMQHAAKQAQQNKNALSWAKSFYKSIETQPAVKSLAEIQQEEAERLVQQQKIQKPQAPAPVVNSNVGVWGNTSHLNRITAPPPSWNMNSVATSGFWDDAVSSPPIKKQPAKSNDSAFPALFNHQEKPAMATAHSNKSKNVRAKKEEDAIKKLFCNRKPTDEFTAWCTEALSAMPSSVDVPTFVAFLKDIESPYEVHDYVKSYLGDGKEPREFAKQFLEKRSKFRAKQTSTEDNSLWGPAPAITPIVNKTNPQPMNDNDGNSNSKGKSKRRKNRMQKLDSSMLGFTVQPNPDRLNVGEIEHIEM